MNQINQSLTLPCKVTIPNRLAKTALTEHLADKSGNPNEKHFNLYSRWAKSSSAFLLTGNVMVDRQALEGEGNVILDKKSDLTTFENLAKIARKKGSELWMQIGHAGSLSIYQGSLSPSGVQYKGKIRKFPKPREASEKEIHILIDQFVYAGKCAQETGFGGIEIHSAHGFLINQFLSPLTNRRVDLWGGSLENRARLLLSIIKATREKVGDRFPIGVKLNSADYVEGGFSQEESFKVCSWLEQEKVDFIEFSGGSYEVTPMLGAFKRDNYFLEFAEGARKFAPNTPFMLTGGIRKLDDMNYIINSSIAQIIGLGRPMILYPNCPMEFLSATRTEIPRIYGEGLRVMEQLGYFQSKMRKMSIEKSRKEDENIPY